MTCKRKKLLHRDQGRTKTKYLDPPPRPARKKKYVLVKQNGCFEAFWTPVDYQDVVQTTRACRARVVASLLTLFGVCIWCVLCCCWGILLVIDSVFSVLFGGPQITWRKGTYRKSHSNLSKPMPKCSGQRSWQTDLLEKLRHLVAFILYMKYLDPFTLTDWSTSQTPDSYLNGVRRQAKDQHIK